MASFGPELRFRFFLNQNPPSLDGHYLWLIPGLFAVYVKIEIFILDFFVCSIRTNFIDGDVKFFN